MWVTTGEFKLTLTRLQGVLFFEHDYFKQAITSMVWHKYHSQKLVQASKMAPLIVLVAASFLVALERQKTGYVKQEDSHEQILTFCQTVQEFISNHVLTNEPAKQRFFTHCGLIMSRCYVEETGKK